MKGRVVLAACVLALTLALLLPAVALASGGLPPGGSALRQVSPGRDQPAQHGVLAAPAASATLQLAAPRLGIITNGPCTVTGVVQYLTGQAVEGAIVEWGYYEGDTWVYGNKATTQAGGFFSFDGVTATTAGELDVYLPNDDAYQAWSLTFAAPPATNDFTLRPAQAPVSVGRSADSNWNYWESVVVDTWGSRGGGTTTLSGGGAAGINGDGCVMPPDYDYAVVYYFSNQAVEWSATPAVPVTAGNTGATSIDVAQEDAQSVLVVKPYWASGRPGSAIRLQMGHWPAGSQAMFYGYSEYPFTFPTKAYGTIFNSGGSNALVSLTIPKNATPGYAFQIHAYRTDTDSALDINDYFQVCTLKPSKAAIRRGAGVRLSGVIPTEGHIGNKAGKPKYVTLYRRTRSASAAPTLWDPRGHGWVRVGRYRANGYGRFVTGYLHPTRTNWYVVRYPGGPPIDAWYWGAYTSVVRVRVY